MKWTIEFTNKAEKQTNLLKEKKSKVFRALRLLVADLENIGPAPGKGWPHYGKLHGNANRDYRHCHLIRGNPTYVCCWEVLDKKIKIIEIYYVGTHEKAPY